MKTRKIMAIICAVLLSCVFSMYVSAEADYGQIDAAEVDFTGAQVPLAEAAPATGIDQSELAMQRAVDVVIFGLGISLASVVTVAAVKKLGSKAK